MGFILRALLGFGWLVSWVVAIVLGGQLGGTKGAIGWGLMVYPWFSLAVLALCLAWRAAKREEADGTLYLRRCLACGRAVSADTAICPDQACDGVDFGYQWDVHRRDAGYRAREEATVADELNKERGRRAQELQWVGAVAWWPYWSLIGWYARGVFGRATYDTDAERLLWWSSRMFALGGIFGALVVNATVGPTSPDGSGALGELLLLARAAALLVGALVVSAYVAVSGPGSMRARLRELDRRRARVPSAA